MCQTDAGMLLPLTPAAVALHRLLHDPSSSHTRDLTDANAARGRVRTALKATRKDGLQDGRGADWAGAARVRLRPAKRTRAEQTMTGGVRGLAT